MRIALAEFADGAAVAVSDSAAFFCFVGEDLGDVAAHDLDFLGQG